MRYYLPFFEETPGQQLEYHENMESFPLINSNVSYAIYSTTKSQITAIYLVIPTCLRRFKNFWGQIWVSIIYTSVSFAIILFMYPMISCTDGLV